MSETTVMQDIREWLKSEAARQNVELAADRDIWKAEAERLGPEIDRLRTEVEALRKDAARWNWYAPQVAALVGESLKEMNAEIDAAMAAKEWVNG